MYKKNEGVTLISLVITIVVMFILIGVTIESGTELLRTSKFKTIQTNMMLIQSRAEVIYEKYTFDGTLSFNSAQVAIINQNTSGTPEQQAMTKELNDRQFFMTPASSSEVIKNLQEKGVNINSEKEYYENARIKRDNNGNVSYESDTKREAGIVQTDSIFSGEGNSMENWFVWDEDYIKKEVSDKIEFGEGEYYLINVYTHDVLYSAGFKDKHGNLFFLLSDMKKGI